MDADEIVSALSTLYSFGLSFIFCEFGERIEGQFIEINDVICELDWYTFPQNIQQMMPIILQCTQRPVELLAYGNFSCSRSTFKKVSKKGKQFEFHIFYWCI